MTRGPVLTSGREGATAPANPEDATGKTSRESAIALLPLRSLDSATLHLSSRTEAEASAATPSGDGPAGIAAAVESATKVSSLLIIGERCPYCSKFRSPRDIIPMAGGAKICVACEQRHIEALHLLSTHEWTGECSECGKKPEAGTGVLAVHFEGGKYRVMCLPCDAIYVTKRRDLYGGTEFAHQIGL